MRPPVESLLVRNEIDGKSLGLHEHTIADQVEARRVFDFQVIKAQDRNKRNPTYSDQIGEWLDRYRENPNPSFMIGVSYLELNRALGYEYRDGLPSAPVTRGSVALVPGAAKNLSTPALSIALTDLPDRNGRWMVIGRVVEGLERVEAIANSPLSQEVPHRTFRPRNPVVIQSARIDDRVPTSAGGAS